MSIIVYGPSGCGKTTFKHDLKDFFGLSNIKDNSSFSEFDKSTDTLYLTNESPPNDMHERRRAVHFESAMSQIKGVH